MKLKRIFTSTLSVLLLTGFLVTTPAEAAMGSEFANNSREYQELKQLAQSFQRGGSCYIDDDEAESALRYVENALYDGFDSQEKFNSGMKKSYGYLLYDCQTMAKQPKEESKPKETQPEKPAAPKETQPEKPKPTKPAKPKQESNVSSKPRPNNSTPKKNNNTAAKSSQSSTTTKPKQNNNNTSSKPKSTQSTVSTTKTKPSNSSTVKETQAVVATAPKETTKETVKETPKETTKETVKETPKETVKETVVETPKEAHEDPTHLLDKNKEIQRETDKESIAETPEDDIKKEQSKSRLPLYIGGLVLVAVVAGVLIAVDSKRKKKVERGN